MIYISLFNSPFYGGGVEQVVKNLLDNFSSNTRNNITLICNDLNQKDEFYFDGIKCVNLKTKRHFILDKLFIFSRLTYSFKIYKFLKENVSSGDIVNIHGLEYSFFSSIFKKKIKNNFSLVVTTHGSPFVEYNNYIVNGLPWKFFYVKIFFFFWQYYFYILEKIELKNVDYLIHINEYFRNYYIKRYKLNPKKNFIIYNGVNLEEKSVKEMKKTNDFSALIIGSTFYRKGLDLAIETVKKLNEKGYKITLNVVGFGDFYRYYKKSYSFVNYIGRVEPQEVKKIITKNDFLLFPSRSEGFPLTVLEALQYGLPIIVSKNCKTNEIKGNENYGYIAPDYKIETFVDLSEKMMNLEKYNFFLENISSLDLSDFNRSKIAKDYEKFFNSL